MEGVLEFFYSLQVLAPKFADRAAGFKPSDVDGEDVEVFPHQFVQQFVGRNFPVWHFDRIQRTRNDTAIKLSRHSGMDCRNPDCREATDPCHPWSLGSGGPCRNDGCVNSIAAKGRTTRKPKSPTPLLPRARPGQCANPQQPDHARFWHGDGGDIARAHGPRIDGKGLIDADLVATAGTEVPRVKRIGRVLGTGPVNKVLNISD